MIEVESSIDGCFITMLNYQRVHDVGYIWMSHWFDIMILTNNNVLSGATPPSHRCNWAMTDVARCHGPKTGQKVHQNEKVSKAHHLTPSTVVQAFATYLLCDASNHSFHSNPNNKFQYFDRYWLMFHTKKTPSSPRRVLSRITLTQPKDGTSPVESHDPSKNP